MIETMNEQHTHVVSEMREFGLMSETYPSLPFLRFKVSLYDDCESSLPLESNFINNAALANLEEVFFLLVTYCPFVALSSSSTPIATSISELTLLASPPL